MAGGPPPVEPGRRDADAVARESGPRFPPAPCPFGGLRGDHRNREPDVFTGISLVPVPDGVRVVRPAAPSWFAVGGWPAHEGRAGPEGGRPAGAWRGA